jgi:hypothetical protein
MPEKNVGTNILCTATISLNMAHKCSSSKKNEKLAQKERRDNNNVSFYVPHEDRDAPQVTLLRQLSVPTPSAIESPSLAAYINSTMHDQSKKVCVVVFFRY